MLDMMRLTRPVGDMVRLQPQLCTQTCDLWMWRSLHSESGTCTKQTGKNRRWANLPEVSVLSGNSTQLSNKLHLSRKTVSCTVKSVVLIQHQNSPCWQKWELKPESQVLYGDTGHHSIGDTVMLSWIIHPVWYDTLVVLLAQGGMQHIHPTKRVIVFHTHVQYVSTGPLPTNSVVIIMNEKLSWPLNE